MKQNLNCSGSTRVDGGEYGEVRVSASLRVDGDLRCDTLQCSGSAKIEGALSCAGEVRCSGSVKVAGEAAMQEGRFSGSVKAQSLHCTGTLQCSGSAKIEGGMQLGKARFSGSCAAEGDIHAEELEIAGSLCAPAVEAERFHASGVFRIDGLLNAGEITLSRGGLYQAGDIGCTVKLKGTRTNDTLSAPGTPVTIDPIVFPEPRYRAAIKTKDQADDEKLGKLLNDAKYEDPTILVDYSKELKQTIIQGQGEHHLNILRSRIASENKLQYDYIAPKIPYRETITKVAQADYRHKKQSGGAGQFGEVHLLIEPYTEGMPEPKSYKIPGKGELAVNIKGKEEYDLPWGGKLQFYTAIVGGAIDARFMPAILKGIMEKMDEGPLTGSYARDIRVIVYDGKMHPVDSNEISFKLAARNAFKEAFRNAGPKIMEPIYDVEVLTPSDYMGAVMSDLQNRRAMIMGMESDKGFDRLNARVPLAELYRYSTTLSSLSSGAATYTMKFASYEQVPADVQDKLLKAYTDTDEE